MFLPALAAILAAQLASRVSGGQVPSIDGILGGVPSVPVPASASIKQAAIDITAVSTRTPGKLRVTENSGVCETTKGVYQASGYGDLTASESVWCVVVLVLWLSGRAVWGLELMLFGFWFGYLFT
jgi:hypothetical protein